jgi:hypothetical protein
LPSFIIAKVPDTPSRSMSRSRNGSSTRRTSIRWVTLEQIEQQGLVTSRLGDPTPQRAGRRKRVDRIGQCGVCTYDNHVTA